MEARPGIARNRELGRREAMAMALGGCSAQMGTERENGAEAVSKREEREWCACECSVQEKAGTEWRRGDARGRRNGGQRRTRRAGETKRRRRPLGKGEPTELR